MKKCVFVLASLLMVMFLQAAPIEFQPMTIYQPDGTKIECFASGDEFFNWLHDAEGYTIIQAQDGWFYYGIESKGKVIPSIYIVGQVNPINTSLQKWAKISNSEYDKKRDAMWQEVRALKTEPVLAPHSGIMNNIVVYIRFADDSEFTTTRQVYDDRFNLPTGNSVKSYYQEVSYGMLTINSFHFPDTTMNTNLSYQDTFPRNYYQPYNATTNPNGYDGSTERRIREHSLLVRAIEWVNANYPIPTSLNIDADNDGYVDNVCFIVRGNSGAWADLLWAHRWSLYSYNVQINGKRVWDYTFQPENQVDVKTLNHELFHALGAPDLYRYVNNNISPAGSWDLMHSGGGHMTAHMKWKYSNNTWITNIPTITQSGTYTLNPLTSPTNNAYKILSPFSASEYFVLEYRQKTGTFESSIPGTGLIIYRVEPSLNGNAQGPPDELYIFRPNGTLTNNGSINSAHFSANVGRTIFNLNSNPYPFLLDGQSGGIDITNITSSGSTISFDVNIVSPQTYTVTLLSNPIGVSTLIGAGTYVQNQQALVRGLPNVGYVFDSWTENGIVVSTNLNYSFTVTSDRILTANFLLTSDVEDIPSMDDTYIYPNPANDFVIINAIPKNVELLVTDIQGRLVLSKNLSFGNDKIDISKLQKGIYFFILKDNENNVVHKVVKK